MINLLWALAAIFLILWVLGISLQFTMGGLIHILLVLVVVVVVARIITGRKII